jgi:hypothetical protein
VLRAVANWRPNYITRIPPGGDLAEDTARTLHEAATGPELARVMRRTEAEARSILARMGRTGLDSSRSR